MPDILIFEDDPSIGDMVVDLVKGRGLTAEHFLSAAGAVQIVREAKPRLVIMDIMMPGIDGLSACHAIRSDSATRHVKLVILSSKSSRVDKEAAARYGADGYFTKPFAVGEFLRSLVGLLGLPAKDSPSASPAPPAPPLVLTLLERGAVLQAGGLWVLFDMGAGVARWLESQRCAPQEAWILLSRYDDSSVAELEAAAVLLAAGCRVKLGGPDSPDSPLQRLAPRMCRRSGGAALPLLYPQREGESQLAPGVSLSCRYARHPGSTMAYRVETRARRVVYCPANELDPDARAWRSHEADKFRKFFSKAHILIHGFRRSLNDPRLDDGLGAGAWEPAVDMAAESGVRDLILLPQPGADVPEGLSERLRERSALKGGKPRLSLARGLQRLVL